MVISHRANQLKSNGTPLEHLKVALFYLQLTKQKGDPNDYPLVL